ncbi:MAG TPA: YitT family protein [Firmicutes bacterium]|nr:YitT family protein [Bacillota bacterium]
MRRVWQKIREYLGVLVGVAITAFGLTWFLIPSRIAAGGVSGLATVGYHLFRFPVGLTMLLLNIPLFIASITILGAVYGAKTFVGTLVLSLLIDLFQPWAVPLTSDPLLAAVYGGVITGIGLGITFRSGGSTGGTDMAAQLLARFLPTSVGRALLLVDGFVIVLAGFAFGPELALYALLSVFITTKTIDVVQEGQSYAKAAFIISDHSEKVGEMILNTLERGATALAGRGVYTGTDREVLYVIVSRSEIRSLCRLVNQIDPKAFVVISDVHEVLGEGFKKL